MLRNNYFGETKTHYKLYKCGKNWAVMGISVFSLGLGMLVTSRPVSADVAATRTSSSAVRAETTSASSSSATKPDSTSASSSSAVKTETTNASSSSATKPDSTSASSSSAVKTETTNASSSSATKPDSTSASSSSATKADSTSASSSSATKADSTSASSSSAVRAETTSASSQETSSVKSQAQSLTATTTGKAVPATSTSVKKNSAQTKVSYSTLLQQFRTSKALASDEAASTHVDKDNFRKYFSLNGSATLDRDFANTGIVTITPNENNKVGNFSLTSKIDMNKDFTLKGWVNLGSNKDGADGIGFAFHSGNTTDVGIAGGNLGIGGLQNAIGFKLDTFFNRYYQIPSNKNGSEILPTDPDSFGCDPDKVNAPYGTFVKTSNQEKWTQDGSKVKRWWVQDIGKPQALDKADIDGQFHDFVVKYDGATRTLTVSYTQASGNVLTWKTTIAKSYQTMAMVVSASTGGFNNLQQFKLTSFDFQEAATVNVKYVDTTGHRLAQGTVNYPDGAYANGRYTTEKLAIPNYRFIKMDDKSLDANGTLTHASDNGTVIYVYAPAYMTTVKTVNETINYVDKSGHALTTKYTANPIHILTMTNPVDGTTTTYYSTTTTATELDATTGKPVDSGWSNSQDFDAVTHPQIKGYTVKSTDAPNSDLQHVAAQTVTGDSSDLEFTVVYTKNASTPRTESKTVNETVSYVDQNGHVVAKQHTDSVHFTRTVVVDNVTGEVITSGAGTTAWTATNGDTTFDAVVSPVVPGSVADKAQTAAVTDLNADSADVNETVTYTKVGSLVPSSSDGNFPGAPTVVYPNDPSDATKVTPAGVPTVPGYTAHDPEGHVLTPGSSYQPSDPTKDTTITYTADKQKGSVSYVDDTTGKTLKTDSISGTTGSKSSYSTSGNIADYKKQGYELVTDGYPADLTFDNDDTTDQNFTVHLKHQNIQSTEAKTVTETIHYQGAGNQTPADNTAQVTFTRQVSTDTVTGEKTYGSWSADQSFAAVTSPVIKGYTPDQAEIGAQTVSGDASDLDFTVIYTKDAPTKPVNPSQPTMPAKPVNSSQPTTPAKPVNSSQPTTPAKPVQAGQAAATNFVDQRLPQTGETDQQHMTLSGLLLLAMSSVLGLFGMTKRQRKE
ncbi:lectin-like domain-containing protein [Loigolactobacillus coryniformis]|uniref:lectin-like domain-containing protein n=1 Tax=Loigolactobacillus coryniformis TaxID=1610 RepID=UPI00177C2145|nr:MucBP domain-containing protein [Loigolactobacillus coryniformis]